MRFRTVLRWTRRVLFVLLIAATAVYLLRDRILAKPLANLVANQLSSALGGRFTLERVEGTYFTNLKLIGLRTVETPPDGPVTRLDLARAEAEFTLFKLRLDSVTVEGLVAELDLDRPSEPSDEPFDLGTLPEFPRVKLDGSITVRAGQRRYAIGHVEVDGDGKTFTLQSRDLDLADEVKAERFGGRLERSAADTLTWTSEDELREVYPRHIRVVLAGDIEARAELGYRGGEIVAAYLAEQLHVVAKDVQIDERIRVDSLEANVDPVAGTAVVTELEATVVDGRCTVRDARVEFNHPFFVTKLAQLDIAIPDIEPYAKFQAGVTLRASLDGGVLDVAEMSVARGPSRVDFRGKATLPADPKEWKQTTLDATLKGDLDAVSIPSDPTLPSMEGQVAISGKLAGTLAKPTGSLSVKGRNVLIDGQPIAELVGRGTLDYPLLALESLVFRAAPGHVDIKGSVHLEAGTLQDGSYDLDITDFAALGRMIPGTPPLKGALRGNGRLAVDEHRTGHLELSGTDLQLGDVKLDSLLVSAQLIDDELEVKTLSAAGTDWQVELRGSASLDKNEGQLSFLSAVVQGETATLGQPVPIDWKDGTISFRDLDAAVFGGTIKGSGSYGDTLALDLVATELGLLDGKVDAKVQVSGTPEEPLVTLAASSRRLVYRGHDAALELKLRQEKDGVVLETLHLDGSEELHVRATGHWPIVVGSNGVRHTGVKPQLSLTAHAVFEEFSQELPPGVGFRRLDLTAEVDGVDANAACRVQDLAWTSEARVVLAGESSIVMHGNAERMVATLKTPDKSPIRTSATITSKIGIDWSKAHEMVERLLDSNIEGSAKLHLIDLSPLGKFAASPVADLRGTAEVDVKLGGEVKAPVVSGVATIDCPHVRLKADIPSLQDLKGRVVFDQTEARIESLSARLGYSPLTVTGKVGLGEDAKIDLFIKGDNLLLARTPYLRMRSSVDVEMSGPLHELTVAGTVDITDVLYSEPIKLLSQGGASADSSVQLFHIRRGALSTMKLDLRVRANETIRLDNNVIKGVLSADLRIRGTGSVPQQEGRIDFRDLRFTFPVTRQRLKIERGSVVFERGDPFNPLVRARAETRKMGYDLTVDVSGKVAGLEIHVTSIPSLPRDEAVLLLTTGALRDNLAESGAYTAGIFAGRAILEKIMGESNPDREAFLDRFDVESGRDVSPSGDPTIQATFRMSQKERWYAFAERDRWGDYNGGIMLRFRFK
ncbi:MAG: translocation/assembly module TamB domain-containing protein [Planctomycetota bacterium]|jgi:autotransporter translocation and assembly factor TamB